MALIKDSREAREKKLESPVTLFAAIEAAQHEFLRTLAYRERRSIADIVREALTEYQARRGKQAGRGRPMPA